MARIRFVVKYETANHAATPIAKPVINAISIDRVFSTNEPF